MAPVAAESSSVDDAATAEVPELLSELYAGDLESFIERRSAMAKQLRAAKRRDDAATIAKARKPTLAAWAINVVARTSSEQVDALIRVGDRLRQAQESLLGGGSPAELRSAMDERRALVRALADDAVARVSAGGGSGDAARDDIAATFEAASLDGDVARELAAGQLTKTARVPVGFDLLTMGASAGAEADPSGGAAAEPSAPEERRRARARARDARAAADAAHDEVTATRDAVTRLEAELDRVERDLERARAALEPAEAAAAAAEAEAIEAEAAAKS